MDKSDAELPVDELVSLAKVVLENNCFEFDEKLFRQKLGKAIGTKFAPGYAFIHRETLLFDFKNKFELWW